MKNLRFDLLVCKNLKLVAFDSLKYRSKATSILYRWVRLRCFRRQLRIFRKHLISPETIFFKYIVKWELLIDHLRLLTDYEIDWWLMYCLFPIISKFDFYQQNRWKKLQKMLFLFSVDWFCGEKKKLSKSLTFFGFLDRQKSNLKKKPS